MYDLQEIANKISKKIPVTTAEYLFLIKNNVAALWTFLISNNPANINNTLRHQLGYIELGFDPDQKAILKQIEMIYGKNDMEEIALVKRNFKLNIQGLEPEFINAFNTILK